MSPSTWLPATVERTAWRFPNADDDPDGVGWLSPSQIKQYWLCPACYYADRVLHAPKRTPIHFAVGTFTHRAAEHIGRAIIANRELSAELFKEAVDSGNDAFESDLEKTEDVDFGAFAKATTSDGKTPRDRAKDVAARTTAFAIPVLAELYVQRGLRAVELPLESLPAQMREAFRYPIKGYVDAVGLTEDNVHIITDIKTSSSQEAPAVENRIQAAIYAAHWLKVGRNVRVGFDVAAKTKAPSLESYWMDTGGVDAVVAMIDDIAERINRGDFPIGQGWNGRHDFDHGLPEMSRAATWPQ